MTVFLDTQVMFGLSTYVKVTPGVCSTASSICMVTFKAWDVGWGTAEVLQVMAEEFMLKKKLKKTVPLVQTITSIYFFLIYLET